MSKLYKTFHKILEQRYQFDKVFSFGSVAPESTNTLQERLILSTDFNNIAGLAALLVNAKAAGNQKSAEAISTKITNIAESGKLTSKDLKTELSKAMHPVKAEELAEKFQELQDAKRPQEQPQQGIWNNPIMGMA